MGNCFSVNNLKYSVQDGTNTVSLVGFDQTATTPSITIPVSVQNPNPETPPSPHYTVVRVDTNAFINQQILTSVNFEFDSQIIAINEGAFADTNLTSVRIPALVATIGTTAFNTNASGLSGAYTLINVYFNNANALTSLGSNIFAPRENTNATVTFYNIASESELNETALQLLPYFSTVHYISGPPPCFHPNTRLLCFNETTNEEEWVKIMDLYKDKGKNKKVKTYLHGYRDIKNIGKGRMINNPQHKIKCMYHSTELLEREFNVTGLMVTGAHAILLDSTQHVNKNRRFKTVDKKWLVRACDVPAYFEKVTDVTSFEFYHLSLFPCPDFLNDGKVQTIFGIYVNGDGGDGNRDSTVDKNMCLMETIDDTIFIKLLAFS